VLKISGIGIEDDFFDLGGDSLLAVQLMHLIGQELGLTSTLSSLYGVSSVKCMAEELEGKVKPVATTSHVLPLRAVGGRSPLFLLHRNGGSALIYRHLAKHLAEGRPIYGIQAPGMQGECMPLDSISKMASLYLDEIRRVQPQGPYHLAGASFGGLVAFEMAQQLNDAGEDVAFLGLIDTVLVQAGSSHHDLSFLGLLRHRFGNWVKLPPAQKLSSLARRVESLAKAVAARDWRREAPRHLSPKDQQMPPAIQRVIAAANAACTTYVRRPYPGPVVVFRALQSPAQTLTDDELGWRPWVRGALKMVDVPGDHSGILEEPNVRELARALDRCLEEPEPCGCALAGERPVRDGA
jgi:thioesterase domain-containing protein/acyl carrier protein